MTDQTEARLDIEFSGAATVAGLRARDLAVILTHLETAVAQTVDANTEVDADDVVVALTAIEAGSVRLTFTATAAAAVLVAVQAVGHAAKTGDYSLVPPVARESLGHIDRFIRTHEAPLTIRGTHGEESVTYRITPTAGFRIPKSEPVKGATVLHGRLYRIGGKRPRAKLVLVNGDEVILTLNPQLARKLAHELYDDVRLTGVAKWDPESWHILEFSARTIEPGYAPQDVDRGLADLRAIPHHWDEVDDVNQCVAEMRGR